MGSHAESGRSVEASGRSVEEAVEAALTRIGLSRDEVEVHVLRKASKGVLGFGAHDAIVRVTEIVRPEAPPPAEPVTDEPAPVPEPLEVEEPAWGAPAPEVEVPEVEEEEAAVAPPFQDEEDESYDYAGELDQDELLEISREVLLEILQRMNVIADVLAAWSEPEVDEEDSTLLLDIVGDDLGLLIGRRGETLRDLQYIVRLIVGRRIGGWANIVVDVEGYKQRRERTVRQLARRMADRVLATGRPVHMEPMNPYERRLVHLELRKIEGVQTKSSGEGAHRKVGIFPENGQEPQ